MNIGRLLGPNSGKNGRKLVRERMRMGIENERGGITRSGLLLLDLGESVDGDDANIYFLYLARPKYRRRTRRGRWRRWWRRKRRRRRRRRER